MKLVQIGAFVLLVAAAVGVAQFFGIINADAYLHPTTAYKRAKLVATTPPPAPVVKIYPEAGCKDQAPLKVVWSLRHQPDRWSADDYNLTTAGLKVWIANEDYGLKINGAFPYSGACRELLYHETEAWQRRRINHETDELTQ